MEKPQDDFRVELRPVDELTPYARNARTHSTAQIDQLCDLILLVGFTNPLLVDDEGIIAGHGRQMAMQKLYARGETVMGPGKRSPLPDGMVPVIDCTGMSDAERRAYVLADNQVALNAEWDRKLLSVELLALKALDFNMPTLGFNDTQLVQFMTTPTIPTPRKETPPPKSKKHTTWVMGESRLSCKDADVKLLRALDAAVIAWQSATGLSARDEASGTAFNDMA